jgi:hypothetical protein
MAVELFYRRSQREAAAALEQCQGLNQRLRPFEDTAWFRISPGDRIFSSLAQMFKVFFVLGTDELNDV